MRVNLQLICAEADRLPALFASLKQQTLRDWSLYLLDETPVGTQRDAVAEAVRSSGLPVILSRPASPHGFGRGHNKLFEATNRVSDAVLVLSSDVTLEPEYVERCLNYLELDLACAAASGAVGASAHETRDAADLPAGAILYRVSAVHAVSPDGHLFETGDDVKDPQKSLAQRFSSAGLTMAIVRGATSREASESGDPAVRPVSGAGASAVLAPVATRANIAVVIVSYNRLDQECLASVARAMQETPLRVEAVIVDNASTKFHTQDLAARHLPQARVFRRAKNCGFGDSCNYGARQSDAEYYFFLNPDTVLHEPDIFSRLYAYMQSHQDVGIAAPKLLYLDGRLQETCRRFPAWYMPLVQRTSLKDTGFGRRYAASFNMRDFDHTSERAVDWVQGSAMFIRAEPWHGLGGFDRRYFMYFEDIDLCRRMQQAGHRVMYVPSMSLLHAYAKESAKIPGLFQNILRNRVARFHLVSWLKYEWKWKGR